MPLEDERVEIIEDEMREVLGNKAILQVIVRTGFSPRSMTQCDFHFESISRAITMENSIQVPLQKKKKKTELSYDPAIPLLGIHPKKILIQKYACTSMFTAALFTILKTLLLLFSHQAVSNSCDPMDCSPPGSSVHEISQAKVLLEWVAILLQGIFPT